jgi:hypothetical protein
MASNIERQNRETFRVFYPDLGGGRNTRKDSHALNRNQLAESINTWMLASHSISKRPGSVAAITTTGATGSGSSIKGMSTARINNVSYIIVQSGTNLYAAAVTDTSYTSIGTLNSTAGPIQTAQMYDQTTGITANAVFIVDGVDVPQLWKGPGHSIAPVGTVPLNHSGSASITPKFVSTLTNSLWYAGEPTEPTGVYISDPSNPESFSYGGQTPGASFIPYLIGYNDGVNGGDITGIAPLGNSMIVYKQSAVYAFVYTGYYGDVGPWALQTLSTSVGMLSPRSLVSFDTFHCFLGIDGVYTCDGQTVSKRPISDNNPDLFDGPTASIVDRTTAVGVRYGARYLLFFDDGGAL